MKKEYRTGQYASRFQTKCTQFCSDFKMRKFHPVEKCDYAVNNDEFDKSISQLRKPVILKGKDIGKCVEKWTANYLIDSLGSTAVQVHVTCNQRMDFINKNFVYRSLPFDTFIQRASENTHAEYFLDKDELYYLRSIGSNPRKDVSDVMKQFPNLSNDIILPEDLYPSERFFSSVFRIGSPGIHLWTHYDVMDNFLMQIRGRKRVVLYSPADIHYMYLNGDKSQVLDIDNPDLEKYPLFSKATPFEAILEPGDILFIPALWFHNVLTLEFSVGVNVFWYNEDPQLYDKKDVYGNRDLVPAARANEFVGKAISELKKLPQEYRDFYLQRIIQKLQTCRLNESQ